MQGPKSAYQGLGSISRTFRAAARNVLLMNLSREDLEQRVIHDKSSLVPEGPSKTRQAEMMLRDALEDGPLSVEEVISRSSVLGISKRMLKIAIRI